MTSDSDPLWQLREEQAARQELLLAELAALPAEVVAELAEQSARAAELLLAELAKKPK